MTNLPRSASLLDAIKSICVVATNKYFHLINNGRYLYLQQQ